MIGKTTAERKFATVTCAFALVTVSAATVQSAEIGKCDFELEENNLVELYQLDDAFTRYIPHGREIATRLGKSKDFALAVKRTQSGGHGVVTIKALYDEGFLSYSDNSAIAGESSGVWLQSGMERHSLRERMEGRGCRSDAMQRMKWKAIVMTKRNRVKLQDYSRYHRAETTTATDVEDEIVRASHFDYRDGSRADCRRTDSLRFNRNRDSDRARYRLDNQNINTRPALRRGVNNQPNWASIFSGRAFASNKPQAEVVNARIRVPGNEDDYTCVFFSLTMPEETKNITVITTPKRAGKNYYSSYDYKFKP